MSEEAVAHVRSHAHELAAMAKTGLAYATNDYDRDRYSRVLRIAEELAGMTFPDGLPQDREYERDIGVITPKTGCSVAASAETPAVAFFARGELPEDMSVFQRALVTHALADAREAVFQ